MRFTMRWAGSPILSESRFQAKSGCNGGVMFCVRRKVRGETAGEANANPLARELLDVIARHDLPRDGFERYLDARQFDLYNDAMPDRTSLEAYFGETESFILKLSASVAGISADSNLADACGHGGVAIGLARRLKLLAHDRALAKDLSA